MELLIDSRAGSNKLLDKFPGECKSLILEFGDIAFFGNGPDDNGWYIGIEYKTLDDFCASMKSGRFTGTQLPGMLQLYDVSFVIIEGIGYMDRQTGQLVKKIGRNAYSMGVQYSGFQNFITTVEIHSALAGKPCMVKRTVSLDETVKTIRATHDWFQKPWEKHTSISRPDQTKIQHVSYDLETYKIPPDSDAYPKYWLRKALFQLSGVGWDVAGTLADKFSTMESVMQASQKDLESVDRVGRGLASRAYKALHGYTDLSIRKRVNRMK